MSTVSAIKRKTKTKSATSIASPAKNEAANSENIETSRFPQINCQDDVISTFFNQIVEFVIEDMTIIEPEPIKEPKQDNTDLVIKDYKDLKSEDLVKSEISSVKGSKITLRRTKSSTTATSLKTSKLSIILEEEQRTASTTSSSLQDSSMEEEKEVRIVFITGNVYEGRIAKRIMNGKGKFTWTDGTVYEGDFSDGFPTGRGEMTLPDLSNYKGDFNRGLFHGDGFLNIVSTPSFYSGQWKNGMKDGEGWLLYQPGDWYEGGWRNDLKDGFGVRYYKNGARYRGHWREGKPDGEGVMIWENNDFYKGGWKDGAMHGEGEYIWNAFYNRTFTFPIQNFYRGSWNGGKRSGTGTMHFGSESGSRLKGTWDQDLKHGDGCLVCGNGMVVEQPSLFRYDKPMLPPEMLSDQILNVPVFTIPEDVDVGYYIDEILEKLQGVSKDKLNLLKMFEAECVKNTIISFLPQLNDLYKKYATIAADTELHFEPVLVRLFLWQLYKDVEVFRFGLSLVDTDLILDNNPKSALDSPHSPFEPIYFWQFLMSLVGVALSTTSLDEVFDSPTQRGVCAYIIKKFFEGTIFGQPTNTKSSLFFTYLNLVPIKAVYSLYQKVGEPHTAKEFLQHTCTKKGDAPMCYLEEYVSKKNRQNGVNFVPLIEHISYVSRGSTTSEESRRRHNWSNLYDFRHLGPRNIVRCLGSVCPLIIQEDLVANMDYPLTFLEFYETLLSCIMLVLDLELKKEKKILLKTVEESIIVQPRRRSSTSKSLKSEDSRRSSKTEKKGIKKKK